MANLLKPPKRIHPGLLSRSGENSNLRTAALGAHTRVQDIWGKKGGSDPCNNLTKLEPDAVESYSLDYVVRLIWDRQRNGNELVQCKLTPEITRNIRSLVLEVLDKHLTELTEEEKFEIPDPEEMDKRETEKRKKAVDEMNGREARREAIKKEKKERELRMQAKRERQKQFNESDEKKKEKPEATAEPLKKTKTRKTKHKTTSPKKKRKHHTDESKKSKSDKKKSKSKIETEDTDKVIKTTSNDDDNDDTTNETKPKQKTAFTISTAKTDEDKPASLSSSRNRRKQFASLPTRGRPILKRDGLVASVEEDPVPTITITLQLVDLHALKLKLEEKVKESFPEVMEVPVSSGNEFLEFYHHSVKGPRPQNEDEYSVIEHVNDLLGLPEAADKYSYFGVFDGHSGKYTSMVTRSQLHWNIFTHPEFPNDSAFIDACAKTDKLVNDAQHRDSFNCGTTALCVCVQNNEELLVGNVGDCRGFLCRAGEPLEIASPHNLDKEHEKERIKALGGSVVWFGTWRVDGILAVSRSIGDYKLKNLVLPDPDVSRIPLTKEDEFVIVASDGLWDGIDGKEMIDIVKKTVQEQGREHVCKALCDVGIAKNTKDNVTVVALFFNNSS